MGRNDRPEHSAPPEVFYNDDEARKYTENTRMVDIQTRLTARALELLALPQDRAPRMLLDLGCGSGLSGQTLTEHGHIWLGLDISSAMLSVAQERELEGDLLLGDLGHGVPVRSGTFDGAVSISAIQWLCNADRSSHDPRRRMRRFFETLYRCLARGARAVLQMYPEDAAQASMLTNAAMKVGFSGGLVVDYPHSTRAKKYFLVLSVGGTPPQAQARGEDGGSGSEDEDMEEAGEVSVAQRKSARRRGSRDQAPFKKSRAWIMRKKEHQRLKGGAVIRPDTKYTGRKRKSYF
ncbi:hypothetical protein H632_c2337p0 [Helicosporidium sp. ATCC 50920]|nr:hypothetical protein H632_c2337p0 [Helicosporidium sp. ATCC 50920]|eukprot:KDD73291.1 hypothetical protein H632_c2337p0 [Helicosporidium sp. ATCC 50920]